MPAAILVICGMAMVSCFSVDKKSTTACPAEPDYRDSTQWYITDRGAAADVFYIISTETGDYTMYNPQNDFFGFPKTKRPKFRAEKQNEMVSETTNTQTKSKH